MGRLVNPANVHALVTDTVVTSCLFLFHCAWCILSLSMCTVLEDHGWYVSCTSRHWGVWFGRDNILRFVTFLSCWSTTLFSMSPLWPAPIAGLFAVAVTLSVSFKNVFDVVFATGDIVSVETVVVPQVKGRARSEWTAWSESVDVDSSYVFALRVFYSKSVVTAGAPSGSRRTSNSSTGPAAPRLQFIGTVQWRPVPSE